MFTRNEKGKLMIARTKSLDLEIFLDDIFEICETEEETEWMRDELIEYVSNAEMDKNEELEQ